MIKPHQTLALLLCVGLLAFITSLIFPKEGIQVAGLKIEYFSFDALVSEDSIEVKNIDEILASTVIEIDSTKIKDSLKLVALAYRKKMLRIQYKNDTPNLNFFFKSLEGSKKTRIVHYGDSQIEGDRITSYIRNEFQKAYGGTGPGFIPAFQVIPNMTVTQSHSENWKRYTAFGKRDSTLTHNQYGLLASFSKYSGSLSDMDSSNTSAWLEIKPSNIGYFRTRRFNQMKLLLGNNAQAFGMQVLVNDSIQVYADTIAANLNNRSIGINFKKSPANIKINFTGEEGPDIYGISLESYSGVIVDNIAMRGSSGTIFRKIDQQQLSQQYRKENIKLMILQYGGNAIPYITSEQRAKSFGRSFQKQIAYLKRLLPNCNFVVIGPSDMSTKLKDKFVTYPILPSVRDALKEAAFEEGCGYWDIYEVMGGANSMPAWVTASPQLAASDYVHFTPKGAKKIAELFYKAIMDDFQVYKGILPEENQNTTDSLNQPAPNASISK